MPDVDGSLYAVRLQDDGMEPGSSMTLRVTFVSEIPEIDDRFGYHEDDVLTMYCLSFCFPQVSLYHDGAWDEDPYYDDGETEVNVMTDYTVTLHAPADLTVAASGHQTTENGVTRIEAPNVREIGIVCCDHMTVYSEEINGVTFNQYCPSYEGLLRFYDNMLANTEAAVEVYTEYIGPYIYDEIDIVPVHLGSCGSGMEMPGLIMNGLPVFFYPDRGNGQPVFSELSYVDSAITTAHETAHQWFYCAVGDDQYDEAWLDESFASFVSEYLYVLEWPDAMDRAVQLDDEEGLDPYTYLVDRADPYSDVVNQMRYMQGMTATPYINWPVSDYPNDYDYTICVYYYGEYFLAELQHAMGDEMFYRMMRDYYADASGQISRGGCFVRCVLSYDHSDEVLDVLERYVDPSALR